MKLIISCEHSTNVIPPDYQYLFKNDDNLATHMGIDFGAKYLAEALAHYFKCPCTLAKVSRLLIDCNRSLKNKGCFSDYTSSLSATKKNHIIDTYYVPYREAVEALIDAYVQKKHRVLHLSIHSFTPVLSGVIRHADFGLLYDPTRGHEKTFVYTWKKNLLGDSTPYRIRMNYPYRGTSDGFTSALRKRYDNDQYMGIELEVNQSLVMANHRFRKHVIDTIIHSLKTTFTESKS